MVSEYLRIGEENAILQNDLSRIIGIDKRTLRELIAEERKKICICSKGGVKGGYWLPKDAFEARAFLKQELSREKSIRDSLAGTFKYICEAEVIDETA